MARRNFDFPEEILEKIMSWVPPESLIRLKCVNKSWNSLINSLIKDPAFVNKHLHNILNNPFSSSTCPLFLYFPLPNHFVGLSNYSCNQMSAIVLSNDDVVSTSVGGGCYIFPIFPPNMPYMPAEEICHCNGLICMASRFDDIVVCNPAITEFRILPEPLFADLEVFIVVGLGFGYDSRANDYKVVRIVVDIYDELYHPRVELYSMKTDSWKEIATGLQLDDLCFLDTPIFCKGVVYWPPLDSKNRSCGILCFDTSDDIFYHIALPDDVQNLQTEEEEEEKKEVVKIAAWNESVVLFSYRCGSDALTPIEVWVMDDCFNGVKGSCSWIKRIAIGPLEGVEFPWTFWKDDEILMEGVDKGLISYNLQTQLLKTVVIREAERYPYPCKHWVFPYVKSLVSVQR